jgi:hypothetical protein
MDTKKGQPGAWSSHFARGPGKGRTNARTKSILEHFLQICALVQAIITPYNDITTKP